MKCHDCPAEAVLVTEGLVPLCLFDLVLRQLKAYPRDTCKEMAEIVSEMVSRGDLLSEELQRFRIEIRDMGPEEDEQETGT